MICLRPALLLSIVVVAQGIHVLPIVDIDLDAAPETRWVNALQAVLDNFGYE